MDASILAPLTLCQPLSLPGSILGWVLYPISYFVNQKSPAAAQVCCYPQRHLKNIDMCNA